MNTFLQQYILKQFDGNHEGLQVVIPKFKPFNVKRNKHLLVQGQVCQNIYFVAEGCLQSYIYDSNMQENTKEIITEGNFYCDLRSFNKNLPAIENIRTVEPSQLYQLSKRDFQELMETVPQFSKVYQKLLEAYYNNAGYRVNTFITLSALDRIKWLMQHRPSLLTRLPSKLIASYLGINKDVYSRLKAKL
ncbi:MAG: cyclic nucleotide-binding domain-containing protein [Cytophagia bacterium]|nr:cyclic nucleotide-binding domain-containing protein [Cytophagia bacterium]NBW36947.1 cyclic nucleotide-binding domain-containing protein [Cytophagia bacterium]